LTCKKHVARSGGKIRGRAVGGRGEAKGSEYHRTDCGGGGEGVSVGGVCGWFF